MMENILAQIGKHLGIRFARIENLFATKKELQTLSGELNNHRDNLEIHKTSAQIRAEITDADIPATLVRDTELSAAINAHDTATNNHTDIRETISSIQNGNITVPRSEYAEKLGTPGDSYTKAQLDTVINTHAAADTRHKTPAEQGKLDHLADDANATYATKTDVANECETIVFTGTYTVLNANTEDRKYTLDAGQADKFTSYFDQARTNPVVLRFALAGEPAAPEQEIFLLNKTFNDGVRHDLEFLTPRPGKIKKIMLRMMKISAGDWGANITLIVSEYLFDESAYKYDRYYPKENFDMNKFTESGGIAAAVYEAEEGVEALVGLNVPPGFTEFYGYVLANYGGMKENCCTQVVTDRVLLKTMMRSSVQGATPENVWTEWKEIGCENKILVVTEYPTDLSTYADGTIFIKQQQP